MTNNFGVAHDSIFINSNLQKNESVAASDSIDKCSSEEGMVSDDISQDVSQPEVSTPEQPQMKQTDSVDEGPMIKMDVPETQNVLKQNRSLGSRLSNIKSCNKTRSEFKNRVRFRKSHDRGMSCLYLRTLNV